MATEPTVFIVEDDQALNDAVAFLLRQAGLKIQTYANPHDFLETCPPPRPGCLIVDVRLPGMSGLHLQEILIERGIRLPIIVMTGHGDIPMAIRAMKAGALDFIEKPFDAQILLKRVREALAQDSHATHQQAQYEIIAGRMASLSAREREVLERVVIGKSNKIIANELNLSVSTVEVHRKRVLEKLKTKSLSELVRMWALYRNFPGKPN